MVMDQILRYSVLAKLLAEPPAPETLFGVRRGRQCGAQDKDQRGTTIPYTGFP